MSISLEDFANGDTDYIAKMNANNSTLETAVGALETSVAALAVNSNLPTMMRALVGGVTTRVSSTSCNASLASPVVTLTAGYVWLNSIGAMVYSAGGAADLTGLANGTWYIKVNSSGTVIYSATSTDALFSVSKSGSTVSALTVVAPIAPGYSDNVAALNSDIRGAFASLDLRLEAIEAAGTGSVGTQPYDLVTFFPGSPANAQLMFRGTFARNVSFPASLTGSFASSTVAATGATVLTLKKIASGGGTTTIGSVDFAGGATAGTFTFAGAVSFSAGDTLTMENQATADGTLANISVTFAGTR